VTGRPAWIAAFVTGVVCTLSGVGNNGIVAKPVLQDASRNIWDGVFTREQARRGRELYYQMCGACHRDDLSGGEDGEPPLAGPAFFIRWKDRTVAEMFTTIGQSMPLPAPSSLTPEVYIDVISFLLEANDVPAGATDLPPDIAKLQQILITEKPAR
jgi:S-disulfanyl-L-cysteine oxidoreductase SoxD